MELKTALVALAAAPLMLSASWAACPVGSTVTLVSPPAAGQPLLTDADINAKVASMQAGTLALTGTFNVNKTIHLKSCLTLKTASPTGSLATLNWAGGAAALGEMLDGAGLTDITLTRLRLVGRGVVLGSFAGLPVGNNFTISDSVFDNVSAANPAMQDNYILKLAEGSNWRITGNTFTISANRTDLRNVGSTGIEGYHLDRATINLNQFNGIDEGIHLLSGLTNSRITNNTVKDLASAGLEFQYGEYPIINPYANNLVSGNRVLNWRAGFNGMGISVALGQNWTVQDNTIIRQGYALSDCNKSLPVDGEEWGPLGIEFTGTNSTAKGNTVCGFNVGITLGIGAPTFAGLDLTTLDNNTIVNTNFGVRMYRHETNDRLQKKFKIVNNVIQDARFAGISSFTYWKDVRPQPQYMEGPEAVLHALTIDGNKITRTARADDLDNNPVFTGPDYPAYTAIKVRPLLVPAALSISGNTISLVGTPPASQATYQGIALSNLWSNGYGFILVPSSYKGSLINNNTISSAAQTGLGISADTPATAVGATLSNNRFSKLAQAVKADLSGVTVSGNTCTEVVNTNGCN
jgi:hypothetical protein